MAKEKAQALYLADPEDGRIHLVHADDVEDRQKAGWKQPEGMQANGKPWNEEEFLPGQTLAAEFAKAKAEADAKKAADEAKEAEKSRAEADKKQAEHDQRPDMKVEVVKPKK